MRNKSVIFIILIILVAGIWLVSDSSASANLPSDEMANASEAKNPSSANATITITWTTVSPPNEVIEDGE